MGRLSGWGRAGIGFLLALGMFGSVRAGERRMNVQGKLTDSSGVPVSGSQVVTFRLYESSSDPVASRVWEDNLGVTFDSGAFNVALGQDLSLDGLAFDKPYYLGIQVAGDSDEMSPRQLLGASAYAMGSLGDFQAERNLSVGGNAGIGTASPASPLHVFAGDDLATFESSSTAGSPTVRIKNGSRTWGLKVDGNSGSGFSLTDETAGQARVLVSSAGYVGIGTAQPANLLDVNGDISASGKVGIGTSGPQAKLDVQVPPGSGAAIALNNNTGLAFRDTNGSLSNLQIYAGTDNYLRTTGNLRLGGGLFINNNVGLAFLNTGGAPSMQLYGGTDNLLHSNSVMDWDVPGGAGAAIILNNNTALGFRDASGGPPSLQLFGGTDNMLHTNASLYVGGTLYASGGKSFLIPNPLDPSKMLVHGAIEGPEFAVYYRGQGQLVGGKASVQLPDYFEALVRKKNRTVQLTCVGGYSPLFVSTGPANGQFEVQTTPEGNPSQAFYWQVEGVRADQPRLKAVKRRINLAPLDKNKPDQVVPSIDEKDDQE